MTNPRKMMMGAAGAAGGNTLFRWGKNTEGQLGLGNTTSYSSPVQLGEPGEWLACASGRHTMLLKKDYSLWACGQGRRGGLGDGTTANKSSPVQIGSLTDWSANLSVSGYGTTFAVKQDGTLWTWGYNSNGLLGTGTNTTDVSSPVQVGSLTNWKQASIGRGASTAVKTDGTMWGWGLWFNGWGNTTNYSSPVQIGSLTSWLNVNNGANSGTCIRTDGLMFAWGQSYFGIRGNGSTGSPTNDSSPVQVNGTGWNSLSQMAGWSAAATNTAGKLYMWGRGTDGELGNGSTSNVCVPTQVGSLTDWGTLPIAKTDGQGANMLVVKPNGTLWSWGKGEDGALGDGSTTSKSSPVQIGSLTTWVDGSASTGYKCGAAFTE